MKLIFLVLLALIPLEQSKNQKNNPDLVVSAKIQKKKKSHKKHYCTAQALQHHKLSAQSENII